jgi:hypothetical protein
MTVWHSNGVCHSGELPSPWLSYGGTFRLLVFSLSVLLSRVFPSGTWGKRSKPSTAVKAGNPRNRELAEGLYSTVNAT